MKSSLLIQLGGLCARGNVWRGAGHACLRCGFALGSWQCSRVKRDFPDVSMRSEPVDMGLLCRRGPVESFRLEDPRSPTIPRRCQGQQCPVSPSATSPGLWNPSRHGDSPRVLWILASRAPTPRSLQSCRRSPSRARRAWSSSPSVTIAPQPKGSWALQSFYPSRSQSPHNQSSGFDLPAQARKQLRPKQAFVSSKQSGN